MIFRSSSEGLASSLRPAVYFPIGVSIFIILGITSESRGIYVATVLVHLEHYALQNYKSAALYLDLLIAFVIPAVLVQEPLSAGSPMTFVWQVLFFAELLHASSLQDRSMGPIVLGPFHFFRTRNQAKLSSIQWRAALIKSHQIQDPRSPLLIVLKIISRRISWLLLQCCLFLSGDDRRDLRLQFRNS